MRLLYLNILAGIAVTVLANAPQPAQAGTVEEEYPTSSLSAEDLEPVVEWRPNWKQIRDLERRIRMPKGAAKLHTYVRYYSGIVLDGEKIIVGRFFERAPGSKTVHGLQIVRYDELPTMFHGSCGIAAHVEAKTLDVGCDDY